VGRGRGAGGMRVPGGRIDARVRDAELAGAGDACDAQWAVGQTVGVGTD